MNKSWCFLFFFKREEIILFPLENNKMRIGRRGWCFRRPPKQQQQPRRSSSFNTSNYYMMTKKSFTKPNYAFHVPGAPLNTTSYLIKSKGITTTHHCHSQHQQQINTTTPSMKNNEYRLSDSLVLDGYGSMKGLMGISMFLNKSEEETNGAAAAAAGESNSSPSKPVRDRVLHGGSRDSNNNGPLSPSRLLSLRIMHRDDQIANLEDESMMMKERMNCIEKELDQFKHRVKLLEEEEEEVAQNAAAMRSVVMIRDCCYCGDAVSVA